MKFWVGNKVDAEKDVPAADVAAQFVTWFRSEDGAAEVLRDSLPLERLLRWWLSVPEHFNCTWVDEDGPESFSALFDLVYDQLYGQKSA